MTARDVIAQSLRNNMSDVRSCEELAAEIVKDLLSAPDSIRQELASLLLPWRPIETAPRDGTEILGTVVLPWGPLILNWDHLEWRDQEGTIYEPTHWLPLPAPPKEDKAT